MGTREASGGRGTRWAARLALVAGLGAVASPACLGDLRFVRGEGDFCDVETPCGEGLYCLFESNECVPQVGVAEICRSDEACLSGFCESGLCCQTGCPGPCRACNVGGAEGSCVAVPEGDDPFQGCPGTTACGPGALCQASPDWSTSWGDQADQEVAGVAVGPDGSVVVVGAFEGTLNFATGPLQNPGEDDLFVAKLAPGGELRWAIAVGGEGRQVAEDVAVDAEGNIYVAGWFTGAIDAEGGALVSAGEADGLALSVDPDGSLRWLAPLSAAGEQRLIAVGVGAGQALVVGGRARGALTLGACQAVAADDDDDALLLTLSGSSGFCTNMRALGSPGRPQAVSALTVGDGDVFVAVSGRGSLDFGPGPLDAGDGDDDVWLARLSLGLATSWATLIEGAGDETASRLAADGEGGVWLVGATTPTPLGDDRVDLERDVLLTHHDAEGEERLRRVFGGPYDQVGRAIAVEPSGDLAIAGDFELDVDFGDGAIASAGGADVFVAKLDSAGAPVWSRPFGSKMDERSGGIALDGAGGLALAFDYEDRVVLGGVSFTPEGQRDVLVTRLNP